MTAETVWAIKHTREWQGFYSGTYLLRKDAIEDHVRQIGGTWKQHYRKGDRAVRVTVTDEMAGILKTLERGALSGIDKQGVMDYEPFSKALGDVRKMVKVK